MSAEASRPSRAPLFTLGGLGLLLVGGCGVFGLLFLGLLAVGVEEPSVVEGGGPSLAAVSDADATLTYTLPAGWNEELLATLRCPAGKGRPLLERERVGLGRRLFWQVAVTRTASGGLRLEAPPEAAETLAALLEGFAGLLTGGDRAED